MLRYNKLSQETKLFSVSGENTIGRLYELAATKDVSNKYRSVDTLELVSSLMHRLPMGLNAAETTITTRGSRATSTNHVVRIPALFHVEIGDTVVRPELVMRNSFAGESTLIINLGFYRQVCSNGMMVGESLIPSLDLRHVNGPKFETNFDNFFYSVETLLQSDIKTAIENKMMGAYVTKEVAAKIIKSLPATVVTASAKKLAVYDVLYPSVRVRQEDRTAEGFNAWNLWNIVNEAARKSARDPNGIALLERESKLMDSVMGAFKNVA